MGAFRDKRSPGPSRVLNMNLRRSFLSFWEIAREDVAFRALGRPFGWSIWFHYVGRWHDRRGTAMPVENVAFSYAGQPMQFAVNARYLGPFKGVFIDREYDCAAELGRRPGRILDLGGNIGFGSVFFSKIFRQSQFAVVELDPRNVPLLRRNLESNGVRATIIGAAIGPVAGECLLRFGDDPACSSLAGSGMHELSDRVEVAVTTVPRVMEQMGWDRVDLVKIDIEGAEESLLSTANEWLARVDAIILEIHPNTTAERIGGYLGSFGFRLERFGKGCEPVYLAKRPAR